MSKTLLFYTAIYSLTARDFVNKLHEINDSDPLTIKLNSPGGDVFAGWGMASNIAQRKGKTTIIVEGLAASMSFILPLFADDAQCLDITNWMVHRAIGMIETEDDQKLLDKVNADLKDKIKQRIDEKKFEKITGTTIDDIFDEKQKRRSIWLTAKEAKEVGLVSKIIKLSPTQIKAESQKFVAFYGNEEEHKQEKPKPNNKVMTKEKLKLEHPDVYKAIFEEGKSQENDRVCAILAYNEIDPKKVVEAIKSGDAISESFRSEMAVKQVAIMKLKDAKDESTKDVDEHQPPKETAEKTAEQKEIEAMQQSVMADLGLKTKKTEE